MTYKSMVIITFLALTGLFGCFMVFPPSAKAEPRWLLMARHGDCVEIESLKRKIPDLGDINDPFSFIRFMNEKGHRADSNELPAGKGRAVEVSVPELQLFLLFVTSEMCQQTGAE
ncbi:MAG: hypothetical protein HZB62_04260 [Nitrospirae bacterium]|nr:hypothetical protein [Nitrospirota bacterium]